VSETPLILRADDDPDILALLALRLEGAGFRVVQAADGEQALALARELQPSVAVLDVMMPRMVGLDVLKALRADPSTRNIRVVLVSARAQQSDIESGLAAGADAYLAKPFQASDLIGLVQGLLAF
jgi:CheY-like chemotaxis protein